MPCLINGRLGFEYTAHLKEKVVISLSSIYLWFKNLSYTGKKYGFQELKRLKTLSE